MVFNGVFQFLGLDANIALGHSGAAVLQQLLDQRDIVAAVLIDLRGIKFPKAVGTDTHDPKIVAGGLQMLLDGPFRYREDALRTANAIIQTVAADELVQRQRHGEHPRLPGFLLRDRQSVSVPVLHDVTQPQP